MTWLGCILDGVYQSAITPAGQIYGNVVSKIICEKMCIQGH